MMAIYGPVPLLSWFHTLEDKVDIGQNASDHALAFGETPKLAIHAAAETDTSKIPATLDAPAHCEMADRVKIKAEKLDIPRAYDKAISRNAAKTKCI